MTDPDDLYTLRQEFWVGNFQEAINEGKSLGRVAPELEEERLEFIYRAHLGLKEYDVVLSEIKDNAPIALQSIKLLALYESSSDGRESIMATLQEWLNDTITASSSSLQLIGAMIYLKEGLVKDALRTIRHGGTLEQRALAASIFLRIDRADYAMKQLKSMQEADEDATLTQLTAAWIDLYNGGPQYRKAEAIFKDLITGGPQYREAELIFKELITKTGPSVTLLNGLGVSYIHQGNYEEADKVLMQALKEDPTKSNADTLINLINTAQHLHKPLDTVNKLIGQLQKTAPSHPYAVTLITLDNAFERCATQFSSHIVAK